MASLYPFLAVFCEQVLLEKDDTISIIRMIDKLTLLIPPGMQPPYQAEAWIVVGFRSTEPEKRLPHKVSLVMYSPDGEFQRSNLEPIALPEAEPSSFHITVKMNLAARTAGMYRVEVVVDDETVITMPLLVVLEQRQAPQVATKPSQGSQSQT